MPPPFCFRLSSFNTSYPRGFKLLKREANDKKQGDKKYQIMSKKGRGPTGLPIRRRRRDQVKMVVRVQKVEDVDDANLWTM